MESCRCQYCVAHRTNPIPTELIIINPMGELPEDLRHPGYPYQRNPDMETILYAFPMESQPADRDDVVLWGFHPTPGVIKMTRKSVSEIYKVRVTPFEGPEEETLYWAWWVNGGLFGDKFEFRHVYWSQNLVRICFPYSLEEAEAQGKGQLLPVNVEILESA